MPILLDRHEMQAAKPPVASTVPPLAEHCRARRLDGVEEYSACLVDEKIACGYRACFFSLGNHCLHPRHREIAERTAAT